MIRLWLPWMCNYSQQINKIIQPFKEIFHFIILDNVGHARACLTKPNKYYMTLSKAFMDI